MLADALEVGGSTPFHGGLRPRVEALEGEMPPVEGCEGVQSS